MRACRMASGQVQLVSVNRSGLRLLAYRPGLGSSKDSTSNLPIPPDPEIPWELQPPAMTKPFTRLLSPMINLPSGVKVGHPFPTNFFSVAFAPGKIWVKDSSKLFNTSQSG